MEPGTDVCLAHRGQRMPTGIGQERIAAGEDALGVEGLQPSEVAQILGLRPDAVRQRGLWPGIRARLRPADGRGHGPGGGGLVAG